MENIITCKGQLVHRNGELRGNWYADVNYSDIFSFLIREVGTKVLKYNSDLYYDLKAIENAITKANPENATIYVCLRETGVDGNEYYQITKKNPNIYGSVSDRYIVVYKVYIDVNYGTREIEITLREEKQKGGVYMNMVFMLNGSEIYCIPISEATTENKLYTIDSLAEAYEVPASEIKTMIVWN